jgi:hypothetical protein
MDAELEADLAVPARADDAGIAIRRVEVRFALEEDGVSGEGVVSELVDVDGDAAVAIAARDAAVVDNERYTPSWRARAAVLMPCLFMVVGGSVVLAIRNE